MLSIWLAAAVAVAAVVSGKAGSNITYSLEVALVLSMLTPLVWAPNLEMTIVAERSRSPRDATTALAVPTFAAALVTCTREAHGQLLDWRPLPYTNELIANSIRSRDGLVP